VAGNPHTEELFMNLLHLPKELISAGAGGAARCTTKISRRASAGVALWRVVSTRQVILLLAFIVFPV
jgi:hypothetical protein